MHSGRCPGCDVTPSKSTESHTNEHAERFFIDITGPFHVTSLGGNRYAILCMDDFTRYKFVRFFKHESDAAKSFANSSRNTSLPQASRSVPSAPGRP